jgi:hypothetical protein
MPFYKKRG